MVVSVFDDMSQCTQADVERLLSLVPSFRREQALRYKHVFGQWTCLKSYHMLLCLLRENGLIADNSLPVWSYNEYGKPFLPSVSFFSISHCKHAVAVAIDEYPIGIDIESIRKVDNSLIDKVMNEFERQQIYTSDNIPLEFTRLWTQKEAVLKLRGTGIIDNLQDVLLAQNLSDIQLSTRINKEREYAVTIATTSRS